MKPYDNPVLVSICFFLFPLRTYTSCLFPGLTLALSRGEHCIVEFDRLSVLISFYYRFIHLIARDYPTRIIFVELPRQVVYILVPSCVPFFLLFFFIFLNLSPLGYGLGQSFSFSPFFSLFPALLVFLVNLTHI